MLQNLIMSTHPDRRRTNRDATRQLILQKARPIFAARGFNDAQLAEIVDAAGVTTGAIYHHFGDKKGLFVAVAEGVEQEILDGVLAAASLEADPWVAFRTGIIATLEICAREDVRRIVFVDAPTVVGPASWREIEMRYAFGAMYSSLTTLMEIGLVKMGDVELIASVLLGALMEAAGAVARAEETGLALQGATETMACILDTLRA